MLYLLIIVLIRHDQRIHGFITHIGQIFLGWLEIKCVKYFWLSGYTVYAMAELSKGL